MIRRELECFTFLVKRNGAATPRRPFFFIYLEGYSNAYKKHGGDEKQVEQRLKELLYWRTVKQQVQDDYRLRTTRRTRRLLRAASFFSLIQLSHLRTSNNYFGRTFYSYAMKFLALPRPSEMFLKHLGSSGDEHEATSLKLRVTYSRSLLCEEEVVDYVNQLVAAEARAHHRTWTWINAALVPVTLFMGLLPGPNVWLALNLYRLHANYAATRGQRILSTLLSRGDVVYAATERELSVTAHDANDDAIEQRGASASSRIRAENFFSYEFEIARRQAVRECQRVPLESS